MPTLIGFFGFLIIAWILGAALGAKTLRHGVKVDQEELRALARMNHFG